MTQLLAGSGIFVAVALVIYAVASQAEERATVRASLRQLDDYQLDNMREKVLLQPFGARILAPVRDTLLHAGRRFWPAGYVENARRKMVIAGRPSREELDRFLSIRVLTIALVPVMAVVLFGGFVELPGKLPYAVFVLGALAAIAGPDAALNRQMQERQEGIR